MAATDPGVVEEQVRPGIAADQDERLGEAPPDGPREPPLLDDQSERARRSACLQEVVHEHRGAGRPPSGEAPLLLFRSSCRQTFAHAPLPPLAPNAGRGPHPRRCHS